MPQTASSLYPLFTTIVLATLAVGLPILFVLAIRFLWDRNIRLSRSKELEKLIWQLHRIATAMEHQMKLSFPAVQPGTEEPHDLAYLQQLSEQPRASAVSSSVATAPVAAPIHAPQATSASQAATEQQPQVVQPDTKQPAPLQISPDTSRHGVNSMFGL